MTEGAEPNHMEKEQWDFILKQYELIRQEQLSKKDKQYQIISLGIGGIASLFALSYQYNIYPFFLIMPSMILISLFIFDAECNAISNVSNYGYYLERKIIQNLEFGWEGWLRRENDQSDETDRRKAYQDFELASMGIMGLLYIVYILGIITFQKSLEIPQTEFGFFISDVFRYALASVYVVSGLRLVIYFRGNARKRANRESLAIKPQN